MNSVLVIILVYSSVLIYWLKCAHAPKRVVDLKINKSPLAPYNSYGNQDRSLLNNNSLPLRAGALGCQILFSSTRQVTASALDVIGQMGVGFLATADCRWLLHTH